MTTPVPSSAPTALRPGPRGVQGPGAAPASPAGGSFATLVEGMLAALAETTGGARGGPGKPSGNVSGTAADACAGKDNEASADDVAADWVPGTALTPDVVLAPAVLDLAGGPGLPSATGAPASPDPRILGRVSAPSGAPVGAGSRPRMPAVAPADRVAAAGAVAGPGTPAVSAAPVERVASLETSAASTSVTSGPTSSRSAAGTTPGASTSDASSPGAGTAGTSGASTSDASSPGASTAGTSGASTSGIPRTSTAGTPGGASTPDTRGASTAGAVPAGIPQPPATQQASDTPIAGAGDPAGAQVAPLALDLGRASAPTGAPEGAQSQPKMGKVGPAGGEGRVGGPATADAPPTPFASFAVASAPAVSDTVAPQHAPAAGTAAQLAPAVLALHRRGADGTHVMTVEVTPEALGRVRVEVELRDGQVALTIAGGSDAARDALRAALPELRRVLEAAGVNTGTLAVSPDDAGSGQPGAQSGAQPGGQFGAGQPDGGRPHHERPAWQSARSDPREAQPERPAPPGRTGAMSLDLQL